MHNYIIKKKSLQKNIWILLLNNIPMTIHGKNKFKHMICKCKNISFNLFTKQLKIFCTMLTNKKSIAKYKWIFCNKTKDIKMTCSQTWSIDSRTHQGFCRTQNKQICNNEKSDPNTKKLNQKANAKKNKLN